VNNFVWVGSRQSDINYTKGFFNSSVTLYGDNLHRNYALCKISNRRIDNNTSGELRDKFVLEYIQKISNEDYNSRFMFYDSAWVMEIKELEQFKKCFICLNDFELLDTVRNKIRFKKFVSEQGCFNLVNSCVVDSADLSVETFQNLFDKFGEPLIFQKEVTSGGSGTFLVTKNNTELLAKLAVDKNRYIVSEYVWSNVPLNVHLAVFSNEIIVFPASVQLIELENNCLLYKGGDYFAFNKLSNEHKKELYSCANKLGKILQQSGFRGICGIDALLDENGKLFLMEVNPRFQGSSNILDRALSDYGYDSLVKINYDSFLHKGTEYTNIDLDNFSVDYSCYSLTYNDFGKQFLKEGRLLSKFGCIECENDGLDVEQQIDEQVYLLKLIFNKSIFKKGVAALF